MSTSYVVPRVPVWQDDNEVDKCPICGAKFSLFFRRHHCRMCGRVVCANCSPTNETYLPTTYVVSPPNQPFLESPHVPHRTCTECAEELRMIRRALNQSSSNNAASESNSSHEFLIQNVLPGADDGYLGRCPVCDKQLSDLPQALQEEHIDNCLKTYSNSLAAQTDPHHHSHSHHRKRMIISKVTEKECEALGECPICYEDFEPGQRIGRLECLCVFHEKCILDWFERKGVGKCPLHDQST